MGAGVQAQAADNPAQNPSESKFDEAYQKIKDSGKDSFEKDAHYDADILAQLNDLEKTATDDQKTKITDLRHALAKAEQLREPKRLPDNPGLLDPDYFKQVVALAPELGADPAKAVTSRRFSPNGANGRPGAAPPAKPMTPAQEEAVQRQAAAASSRQSSVASGSVANTNRTAEALGRMLGPDDGSSVAAARAIPPGADLASGHSASEFHPAQHAGKSAAVPALTPASKPVEPPTLWERAKSLGSDYVTTASNYAAAKYSDLKETGSEIAAAAVSTGKQIAAVAVTTGKQIAAAVTTPIKGWEEGYKAYSAECMKTSEKLQQDGAARLEKGGVGNTIAAGWDATLAFGNRVAGGDTKTIKQVAIGAAVCVAAVAAAPAVLACGAAIAAGSTVAAVAAGTTAVVEGGLAAATTYGAVHGTAALVKKPDIANAALLATSIVPIPYIGKISEVAGKYAGKAAEKAITALEKNPGEAEAATAAAATTAVAVGKAVQSQTKELKEAIVKGTEKTVANQVDSRFIDPAKDKAVELARSTHEGAEGSEGKELGTPTAEGHSTSDPAYGVLRAAFHPTLAMAVP
jgi:hypothetical protein